MSEKSLENLKKSQGFVDKELARKAQKKSTQKKIEKKELKALLEIALTLPNEETGEINQIAITNSLIEQAIKGNVNAYITIRDTLGEKPTEKHEITNTTPQIVVANQADADLIKEIQNVKADKHIS